MFSLINDDQPNWLLARKFILKHYLMYQQSILTARQCNKSLDETAKFCKPSTNKNV